MPCTSVTEYIMQMSLGADVGPRVAAGHRRDHHLGHADRQRAHAGWWRARCRRAAGRRCRPPRSLRVATKRAKASAIAVTALPRSPLKTAAFAVGMVARHLARMHRCGRRLARGREVDGDDAQAELFEALAQEGELAALGVEGAGDVGGARRCSPRPGSRTPAPRRAALRRTPRVALACRRIRPSRPRHAASRGRRRRPRDVRDRRRRAAGIPAVEAAHRPRRDVVERRRAVAVGAAHGEHLRRRRRRRGDRRRSSSASSSPAPERRPSSRSCSSRSAPSSAADISCAMRPLTITPTRSATSIATPRFCSISSTAISLSAARPRSASTTCSTIIGARPSVGSSITSSFGSSSSARPIASICCSPPESCAPPLSLRSARRGNIA